MHAMVGNCYGCDMGTTGATEDSIAVDRYRDGRTPSFPRGLPSAPATLSSRTVCGRPTGNATLMFPF
eukprot:7097374-Pyramimonas_sp.AAC.1